MLYQSSPRQACRLPWALRHLVVRSVPIFSFVAEVALLVIRCGSTDGETSLARWSPGQYALAGLMSQYQTCSRGKVAWLVNQSLRGWALPAA